MIRRPLQRPSYLVEELLQSAHTQAHPPLLLDELLQGPLCEFWYVVLLLDPSALWFHAESLDLFHLFRLASMVFAALADILVPRMMQSIAPMLQRGAIPAGWALGLLSPIPKQARLVSITALRPICLQNVLFKWVSATVYLMLEDVVAIVTPSAQKAFIKGRFIFDHVWDARGAWVAMQQWLMASLDLSKACDRVHYNYFVAFSLHVGLPIPLISVLVTIFKAQFVFAVGTGGGQRSRRLPPIRRQARRPPLPSDICNGMLHHRTCPENDIPTNTHTLLCTRPPAVHPPPPPPPAQRVPSSPSYLSSSGSLAYLWDCNRTSPNQHF